MRINFEHYGRKTGFILEFYTTDGELHSLLSDEPALRSRIAELVSETKERILGVIMAKEPV